MPELAEIRRDQRIGGRNGSVGYPDPDRGHAEQEVLHLIAGKDHQRAFRGEPGIEQRLRQGRDAREHLGKGQFTPAVAVAIGDQHCVRGFACPALQGVDNRTRIWAKRLD